MPATTPHVVMNLVYNKPQKVGGVRSFFAVQSGPDGLGPRFFLSTVLLYFLFGAGSRVPRRSMHACVFWRREGSREPRGCSVNSSVG